MEAQAVLARARSGDTPPNWTVWPMRRGQVLRMALLWTVTSVAGFVLFAPAVALTVPGNFERGGAEFVFTGIVLALLGAVAFGGAGVAIFDYWRLAHADAYLLVMTPDDYVKQEPRKLTHVPMEFVRNITLKGGGATWKATQTAAMPMTSGAQLLRLVDVSRLASLRREPAQRPLLAFEDARTGAEVIVSTDDAFDKLGALEYMLSLHADAFEIKRMRARQAQPGAQAGAQPGM